METRNSGHPAVRYGLIFGGLLALISIANTVFQQVTGLNRISVTTVNGVPTANTSVVGPAFLLGCVGFLLTLGLTFLAGMIAAKQTGKTGTGAIAGLIAGLVGAVVGGIVGVVTALSRINEITQTTAAQTSVLSPGTVQAIVIGGAIFGFIFALALNAGIGAGMGALGGLVGKERSPLAPSPVPVGYPSYPGYPPYPGYPGYPPTGAQPGAQPGMWPQGMPPAGQPWPTGAPPSAPIPPMAPPPEPHHPHAGPPHTQPPNEPPSGPTFSPPPPEHHGH